MNANGLRKYRAELQKKFDTSYKLKITIMSRKTIKKAREYYEAIKSYEERHELQYEFGRYGEPDREVKFYRWLRDNKL
jgi:hypothetical protein